jgi:hypothetical protein
MTAAKAWVTGGVGVFSEQINTVAAWLIASLIPQAPPNVQSAIAMLAVGVVLGLVTYLTPNAAKP